MAPRDWGCAQVLWAMSIKYSSGHSEYKATLCTRSVLAPESGHAVQYDQSGYAVQYDQSGYAIQYDQSAVYSIHGPTDL